MKTIGMAMVLALGSINLACSGEYDAGTEGEVAEVADGLSVSECRDAEPTVTKTGSFVTAFTSPQTYDDPGCFKAKVVRINDVNTPYDTLVFWADTLPTTKASCEASLIRAITYRRNGTNWVAEQDVTQHGSFGSVFPGGSPECSFFGINPSLGNGNDYKLAVTARNSSNATRKVKIQTFVVN